MSDYGDTSWVLQSQNLEQTETNNILTEVYYTDIAALNNNFPALGATHEAPYGAFVLKRSLRARNQEGNMMTVTLEWETPTLSYEVIPPTQYAENSAVNEVSIKEHPKFNSTDWQDAWDDENDRFSFDSELRGIETYFRGTKSVTVRTFSLAKPNDPSGLIGKKGSPGASYGPTDKWLCMAANRSQEAGLWVVTKEFLYNPDGWNDEVYN